MRGPVVLTGGGTGGHVFPMVAIAEALEERGLGADDLRYVGSRRGQEGRLLAGGPVGLTLLPGRGLRRSFRPRALASNVLAVLGLAVAVARALVLVARWRPRVVVSVGGYAALAVCVAAIVERVPLVLVDFDAVPGAVHRLARRFAARRCVALASPNEDAVVTGTPLRAAIEAVVRTEATSRAARRAMVPPIDERRLLIVAMSGSLGSRTVNDAVVELADRWSERDDVALVQVTGRRDHARVLARRGAPSALDYRVVEFADMVPLWTACNLAICRAGAVTVAELTRLGIPAVLVPLPGAPGDHQTLNARALEVAGAARVIADSACDGDTLAAVLDEVAPAPVRAAMSAAAQRLGRPAAARSIADVVLEVAG